nr:hypothetical protein [Tanacetum cinerariifolium]
MVDPVINELANLIVKVEEKMVTPGMDIEEDLGVLFFDDDDSSNEEFEGPEGGSFIAAAEGHSLTLLAPEVSLPSLVIEDLCTRMGNLEYGHGLLVKKVMTVSDVEVADSIAIKEIRPRVYVVETYLKVVGKMVRWLDEEIPRNQIPRLKRDLFGVARFLRWVEAKVDRVDYASRGAKTLELELQSSSNEQRAHDAQLSS